MKVLAMDISRSDRERELSILLRTEEGRQVLVRLLRTLKEIPEGTTLPSGELLVQHILAIEFPDVGMSQ